ncbi:MAG: VOC family protein [Egibacteraceae bacterium]
MQDPPEGMTRIIPYLLYEDVAGALDWLATAFGFRERLRYPDPDGRISHAEMELGDGVIMLGQPGADYRNPKRLGSATQLVCVYIDDVDAHCERAKQAGASILREPADQDYGERSYMAEDPEGHQWSFARRLRDVAPKEWGAQPAVR